MAKTGFTLVELMVVIAIIAVLAIGSVASYDVYLEKARIQKGIEFEREVRNRLGAATVAQFRPENASEDFDLVGVPVLDSAVIGDYYEVTPGNYLVSKEEVNLGSTQNMTIAAWIKPTATPPNTTAGWSETVMDIGIFRLSFSRGGGTSAIYYRTLFGTTHLWPAYMTDSRGDGYGCFNILADRSFCNNPTHPVEPRGHLRSTTDKEVDFSGKWQFMVGSIKDGVVRLYIDGDLIAKHDTGHWLDTYNSTNSDPHNHQLYTFDKGYMFLGTVGSSPAAPTTTTFTGGIGRVIVYGDGYDGEENIWGK